MNIGVSKFTDDIELPRVIKTKRDCEQLQKFLSKLEEWAINYKYGSVQGYSDAP